jgi:pimeloyl-ACP methyl ester carboxylesterase
MNGRRWLLGALCPLPLWAFARLLSWANERRELHERPYRTVMVEGASVHYRDEGRGPTVVLIHGMGGSLDNFRRTFQLLVEAGFRVLAVDLLGFGYSDRALWADLSPQGHARTIVALLDEVGVGRASFIGHSLGGAIALHLAYRYPERVERLVLVSSAVPGRLIPGLLRPIWWDPVLEVIVSFCLHFWPAREMLWRGGVYDAATLTPELREAMRRPSLIRGTTRAVVATGKAFLREAPLVLREIRHPVLILWGAEDRWLDLRSAYYLLSSLPNARLRVIPRARHMVLEERPEEAHAEILAFLTQEPTPTLRRSDLLS